MEEKISWLISDISIYSPAIPFIAGLICFYRLRIDQKAIFQIAICSIIAEVAAYFIIRADGNQAIIYLIFSLIEYGILSYIFASGIRPFLSSSFFWSMSVFFFLFFLFEIIFLSGIARFNAYSTAIESLIIIAYALIFFYKTLKELKIRHLEQEPLFWLSTGVLLYFSSSFFIFLFTNYVSSSNRVLFIIWGIHAIFNILLNVFYSIAIWVKPSP